MTKISSKAKKLIEDFQRASVRASIAGTREKFNGEELDARLEEFGEAHVALTDYISELEAARDG